MKILLTVDPEIPVPPVQYGGIERIASSLCKAYTEAGHEVYLISNPNSTEPNVKQRIAWKGLNSGKAKDIFKNAFQLLSLTKQIKPDIIHSFSRLLYLYPVFLCTKTPVVMSYQRQISPKSTGLANFFSGKKLHFTACGAHMFRNLPNQHKWTAIHNFTDTDFFSLPQNKTSRDILFFLGRIEPIKGTKEAIEIAEAANIPLIIAGNIPQEHEEYFKKYIEPKITNPLINYVGAVNDQQKLEYFQRAKAMLFPISWEEPFGIVMAESMACGCPVLAFNRGSVDEVVENGKNGYKVNTKDEMIEAIKKLEEIGEGEVRKSASQRFSLKYISEEYLKLFKKVIND